MYLKEEKGLFMFIHGYSCADVFAKSVAYVVYTIRSLH